jgi:hypothetical protein
MRDIIYNFNLHAFVKPRTFSIIVIGLICSFCFFTLFPNLQIKPYTHEAYQYSATETHILNIIKVTFDQQIALIVDDDNDNGIKELENLGKQIPNMLHLIRIYCFSQLEKQKYGLQKIINVDRTRVNSMRLFGIFLTSMRC